MIWINFAKAFLETTALLATMSVPFIAILALNAWRSEKKHELATRVLLRGSKLLRNLHFFMPALINSVIAAKGADADLFEAEVKKRLVFIDDIDLDVSMVDEVLKDKALADFLRALLDDAIVTERAFEILRIEDRHGRSVDPVAHEAIQTLLEMRDKWKLSHYEEQRSAFVGLLQKYL